VQTRTWIGILILTVASAASGQQPATILIKTIDGRSLTLGAQDFAKLPQVKLSAKDHDGKDHEYSGVKLRDVLSRAGVPTGHDLRGKEMADYVVVEAADGYRVVFSLAELDPDFSNTQVIVAESADGQPLGAKEGPLRLVVSGDTCPARWVRMVTSVSVVRAQ
jgi:DMSO/TMAO reductase YedYZ molybdopterin-dependent catalytic subunit